MFPRPHFKCMRTHEFGRKPAIYLGIFLLGNLLHASAAGHPLGPGGGFLEPSPVSRGGLLAPIVNGKKGFARGVTKKMEGPTQLLGGGWVSSPRVIYGLSFCRDRWKFQASMDTRTINLNAPYTVHRYASYRIYRIKYGFNYLKIDMWGMEAERGCREKKNPPLRCENADLARKKVSFDTSIQIWDIWIWEHIQMFITLSKFHIEIFQWNHFNYYFCIIKNLYVYNSRKRSDLRRLEIRKKGNISRSNRV